MDECAALMLGQAPVAAHTLRLQLLLSPVKQDRHQCAAIAAGPLLPGL